MSSVISYLRADDHEPASRETLIFAFGVILIAIGGVFAFLTLGIAYGLALGAMLGGRFGVVPTGMSPAQGTIAMLSPILLFSVSAVVFIWTGIGSVRLRRWCRPIVMSLSALAVAWGLLFLANLAVQAWFLPDPMPAPVGRRGGAPAGASGSTSTETVVFLTTYVLLGIVVPFVFFAAYRDRQVERTLDEADPNLYWTDRCPMPALAFALMMVQFAYVLLLLLPFAALAPATPLFGIPLAAAPASAVFLLTAALCVVAAHFTHKQNPIGPLLAMVLIVAAGASVITSMHVEPPTPPPPGHRRYGSYPAIAENHTASVVMTVAVHIIPAIIFALWVLRLQESDVRERHPAAAPDVPPPPPQLADMAVPPVRVERPPLVERLRGGNRPLR